MEAKDKDWVTRHFSQPRLLVSENHLRHPRHLIIMKRDISIQRILYYISTYFKTTMEGSSIILKSRQTISLYQNGIIALKKLVSDKMALCSRVDSEELTASRHLSKNDGTIAVQEEKNYQGAVTGEVLRDIDALLRFRPVTTVAYLRGVCMTFGDQVVTSLLIDPMKYTLKTLGHNMNQLQRTEMVPHILESGLQTIAAAKRFGVKHLSFDPSTILVSFKENRVNVQSLNFGLRSIPVEFRPPEMRVGARVDPYAAAVWELAASILAFVEQTNRFKTFQALISEYRIHDNKKEASEMIRVNHPSISANKISLKNTGLPLPRLLSNMLSLHPDKRPTPTEALLFGDLQLPNLTKIALSIAEESYDGRYNIDKEFLQQMIRFYSRMNSDTTLVYAIELFGRATTLGDIAIDDKDSFHAAVRLVATAQGLLTETIADKTAVTLLQTVDFKIFNPLLSRRLVDMPSIEHVPVEEFADPAMFWF